MLWSALKRWWLSQSAKETRDTQRRARTSRPRVEQLEDRCVPSTVYALAGHNHLLSFDSADPGTIVSDTAITGVRRNLIGIDFRPATGTLYALTRTNLYTIDTATGVATKVGSTPLDPAANGGQFGFDFNPTVDRIRVVSNNGQNLRLNPNTGAVAVVDTNLAYAAGDANAGEDPHVVGAAYTNNDNSGTTGTTLYDIDSELDILLIQNPPNNGTLNTVGSLGVNFKARVGFDIFSQIDAGTGAATSNTAYASSNNDFYTIDLTTGTATFVGTIGTHQPVRDIAVATI
jgi:uncharacterized protein DUF4394